MEMFFLAMLFSIIASITDFRSRDVEDWIPYFMVILGLGYYFLLYLQGFHSYFILSIFTGTIILIPGYLYYIKGGWGEADAWIFAAMFYMIPIHQGNLFLIPYLINLPVVIIGYVLLYSIYLGIRNTNVFIETFRKLRENIYFLILPFGLFLIDYLIGIISFMIYFFIIYLFIVQDLVLKRKVSKNQLKEGDVIEGSVIKGLTKKEISKLKGKTFTVITGIPFIPVFPITLYITYFYTTIL